MQPALSPAAPSQSAKRTGMAFPKRYAPATSRSFLGALAAVQVRLCAAHQWDGAALESCQHDRREKKLVTLYSDPYGICLYHDFGQPIYTQCSHSHKRIQKEDLPPSRSIFPKLSLHYYKHSTEPIPTSTQGAAFLPADNTTYTQTAPSGIYIYIYIYI